MKPVVLLQQFINNKVWRVVQFPSGLRRIQTMEGPYFENWTGSVTIVPAVVRQAAQKPPTS